jgi:mRNA-degrading endonuclease YafQ of YafQ-DinJ toxin-antitoxin module
MKRIEFTKQFQKRLTGQLKGFRAFSVGGDVRVVYQETEDRYLLLDNREEGCF